MPREIRKQQPTPFDLVKHFRDAIDTDGLTTVDLSPQHVMRFLKRQFPNGKRQGATYSHDTTWEFRGERAQVKYIFTVNSVLPHTGPTTVMMTRVTDLADFRPGLSGCALHALELDGSDEHGVVPSLANALQQAAMREQASPGLG